MRAWRSEGQRLILAVSGYAVHKNFETLVDAVPLLLDRGESLKLVMTISAEGVGAPEAYEALMGRIERLGVRDHVRCVGPVAWGQLQHAYRAADVFVIPSLTESFGQTMVEAMSCGLPIVASDVAVNREVLRDAALFFDTFDAASCAEAIARVLEDSGDLESILRQRALARSRDFSWTRYATELLAVFRGIAHAR